MGIIAHYITKDWRLVEELIGFENMKGCHSGLELAKVVNNVLTKHQLVDQVLTITTDNVSSNSTMVTELNTFIAEAVENNRFIGGKVVQMPCLAYVIQLAIKALLRKIWLNPTNNKLVSTWEEQQQLEDLAQIQRQSDLEIPFIVAKVCDSTYSTNLSTNLL